MDDATEERLAAVERALTDDDHDLAALAEAEAAHRVDELAEEVESLDDRVAELEAATQALRGYVGNVRAVNEEVRERADLALEAVERGEATSAGQSPTDEPTLSLESESESDPRDHTDARSPTESSAAAPHSAGDAGEQTPARGERPPSRSRADDHCPYCDGDRVPTRAGDASTGEAGPRGDSRPENTGPDGARRDRRFESVTDGGQADDDRSESGEAGLLQGIRSLL